MITIITISLFVFISLIAAYFIFLIWSNEGIVNKQSRYLTITNKTLSFDIFECKRTILVNWMIAFIVTSNFSNKEQRVVNLIITLDPNHDNSL